MRAFRLALYGLVILGLGWLVQPLAPAGAQNPTCPTRPLNDKTNACASTAFVQNAIVGVSSKPAGSNTQVQFNNAGAFGASPNLTWVSPKLTIGVAGSVTGQIELTGSTSGAATIQAQATAGTPTITLPNASGTVAVSATSPLALSATTGALTCTGCLTNTPAALTRTDDTNVTLTLGGTPSSALLQATSITAGWTGQLAVGRGGTGIASGTSGGVPYFSGPTTIASSGALTKDAIIVGGGAGAAPNTPATTPPTVSSAGIITVPNATGATSKTTGAIVVTGGIGTSGDSYFGGFFVNNRNSTAINSWSGIVNNPLIQYQNTDTASTAVTFDAAGATNQFAFRRMNNTVASPSALISADLIGIISAYGYDGSAFSQRAAAMDIVAAENWSGSSHATNIILYTTPKSSTTLTEAARVHASGGLSIGTSSDPGIGLIYTNSASFMSRTKTSWSSGAAAKTGTLTNAPADGNPTKWIPVDDNGTTRYIPAW